MRELWGHRYHLGVVGVEGEIHLVASIMKAIESASLAHRCYMLQPCLHHWCKPHAQ